MNSHNANKLTLIQSVKGQHLSAQKCMQQIFQLTIKSLIKVQSQLYTVYHSIKLFSNLCVTQTCQFTLFLFILQYLHISIKQQNQNYITLNKNMHFSKNDKSIQQINNDNNMIKISEQLEITPPQNQPPNPSDSSQKKFLNHFKLINPQQPSKKQPTSNTPQKYRYKSPHQLQNNPISTIDKIVDLTIKQSHANQSVLDAIAQPPIIPNLNYKIKQKINNINHFFNSNENDLKYCQNQTEQCYNLNNYIHGIINISNHKPTHKNQQQHNTNRIKNPNTQHQHHNIFTNQLSPNSRNQQNTQNTQHPIKSPLKKKPKKFTKVDLLLFEINRQKNKKGLFLDFYKNIQIKLMELLQYILHDQPQYFGLSMLDKIKEVLKNLESFKGKTIDGEPKVSLLLIFFQNFHNLKKQKQHQKQLRPRKHSHNSPHTHHKRSSTKYTPSNNQQKNLSNSLTQKKSIKNQQFINPMKINNKIYKQSKENQWIGQLKTQF